MGNSNTRMNSSVTTTVATSAVPFAPHATPAAPTTHAAPQTHPPSTPTIHTPSITPSDVFEWQDDMGHWNVYDPLIQGQIRDFLTLQQYSPPSSTTRTSHPNPFQDFYFGVGDQFYMIDFASLTQTNVDTGTVRHVRVKPKVTTIAKVANSKKRRARITPATAISTIPANPLTTATIPTIQTQTQTQNPILQRHHPTFIPQTSSNLFTTVPFSSLPQNEECPLCLEKFTNTDDIVIPHLCTGHYFHRVCENLPFGIGQYMAKHSQCPVCKKSYGVKIGNMPNGVMSIYAHASTHLPGYESYGTIEMIFAFPSGFQDDSHPHPFHPYKGDQRVAYLPDNPEGRRVMNLFRLAWERKLLFSIGYSVSRGCDDCIIFNGIHMKTSVGTDQHGWPDPTYLTRVTQELADKGVVM